MVCIGILGCRVSEKDLKDDFRTLLFSDDIQLCSDNCQFNIHELGIQR